VNAKLAADFFNTLNHPKLRHPSQANLTLTNPNTLGPSLRLLTAKSDEQRTADSVIDKAEF
jgi:hypothetical protein